MGWETKQASAARPKCRSRATAIAAAIGRGLARVEAGAQGQHKIARGYLPAPVHSAHFIADPALRGPVEDYLRREMQAVEEEMEWLSEAYSPFRQSGDA